jgi:anti-sigma regulatory factor (Ser/Thr protein kinase)
MEDASVDRLLAANGHRGARPPEYRPLEIAEVAAPLPAGQPAATRELAARPESARAARDFTRLTLREWGLERLSDVAELVVSELVTNALRHGLLSARWMPGEHPIRLRLLLQDPYLMCMVTDPDSVGPARIDSHPSAESGRGLQVVEACSVRWGWQPLEAEALDAQPLEPGSQDLPNGGSGPGRSGKVVWALLQAPELRRITSR